MDRPFDYAQDRPFDRVYPERNEVEPKGSEQALRLRAGQASDFELAGKGETPFHGGEPALRPKVVSKGPSSLFNGPKLVH